MMASWPSFLSLRGCVQQRSNLDFEDIPLVNWFQVKSGMSSKSRLLLCCTHPLKERNEGHEAIIILRFTEFLHQALCFFLSQLLSKVGQKSEQLITNHGIVVIFVIELQDFNKVMEATLVLGVLARLVHGEDISLGEHLLSLLCLSTNFLDGPEGWVEVAGTNQVSCIKGINFAITLEVINIKSEVNSVNFFLLESKFSHDVGVCVLLLTTEGTPELPP